MDDKIISNQTYTLHLGHVAKIAQLKEWLGVNASEVVRRAVALLYETELAKHEQETEQ